MRKATTNNCICVRGADIGDDDYYGWLGRIVRLEYPGAPLKKDFPLPS